MLLSTPDGYNDDYTKFLLHWSGKGEVPIYVKNDEDAAHLTSILASLPASEDMFHIVIDQDRVGNIAGRKGPGYKNYSVPYRVDKNKLYLNYAIGLAKGEYTLRDATSLLQALINNVISDAMLEKLAILFGCENAERQQATVQMRDTLRKIMTIVNDIGKWEDDNWKRRVCIMAGLKCIRFLEETAAVDTYEELSKSSIHIYDTAEAIIAHLKDTSRFQKRPSPHAVETTPVGLYERSGHLKILNPDRILKVVIDEKNTYKYYSLLGPAAGPEDKEVTFHIDTTLKIGSGGYGNVFEGPDFGVMGTVVKTMAKQNEQRVVEEAEIMYALSSVEAAPQLVDVLLRIPGGCNSTSSGSYPFDGAIIMERYTEDFKYYMSNYPPHEVELFAQNLYDLFARTAQMGYICLDLKPSNILVKGPIGLSYKYSFGDLDGKFIVMYDLKREKGQHTFAAFFAAHNNEAYDSVADYCADLMACIFRLNTKRVYGVTLLKDLYSRYLVGKSGDDLRRELQRNERREDLITTTLMNAKKLPSVNGTLLHYIKEDEVRHSINYFAQIPAPQMMLKSSSAKHVQIEQWGDLYIKELDYTSGRRHVVEMLHACSQKEYIIELYGTAGEGIIKEIITNPIDDDERKVVQNMKLVLRIDPGDHTDIEIINKCEFIVLVDFHTSGILSFLDSIDNNTTLKGLQFPEQDNTDGQDESVDAKAVFKRFSEIETKITHLQICAYSNAREYKLELAKTISKYPSTLVHIDLDIFSWGSDDDTYYDFGPLQFDFAHHYDHYRRLLQSWFFEGIEPNNNAQLLDYVERVYIDGGNNNDPSLFSGNMAIFIALALNDTLEVLLAPSNGINDNDMFFLGKALHHNKTLRQIDLRGNTRITEVGWKYLSDALVENNTLSSFRVNQKNVLANLLADERNYDNQK